MTVVRLTNREIVVVSPIQVDSETVGQLNQLGTVAHIVAPNLYHYLFAADFKALYPEATFWAAPGLKLKEPDLPIDKMIEDETAQPWNELKVVFFDGFKTIGSGGFDLLNECVFFHPKSRTLILTDAAFNFDESFPLATQLAARVGGGYKSLSPSLLEKIATTDKKKVKESLNRVLDWDFERVIMAHGSIVETDGKRKLRMGYARFFD